MKKFVVLLTKEKEKTAMNEWVGMVKNGCGQSGQGTLKLTVSQ